MPKELCETYGRKDIGQPVTLTSAIDSSSNNAYVKLFVFDIFRSLFTIAEANHSSCHYATKLRWVQIDGDSVNSVSLQEQSNYRSLLIPLGVHLSQTRRIISFRHNIDAIDSWSTCSRCHDLCTMSNYG